MIYNSDGKRNRSNIIKEENTLTVILKESNNNDPKQEIANPIGKNGILFFDKDDKLFKKQKTNTLFGKPQDGKNPFFKQDSHDPSILNRNKLNILDSENKSEDEDDEMMTRTMSLSSTDIVEFNKRLASFDSKHHQSTFFKSLGKAPETISSNHKTESFLAHPSTNLVTQSTRGDEFIYDLEIVSNRNEKEIIKVSFQPSKGFNIPSKLPNPFDRVSRDLFFNQHKFTLDYQNGYAPIAIQAQQEDDFSYKDHFIRRYPFL